MLQLIYAFPGQMQEEPTIAHLEVDCSPNTGLTQKKCSPKVISRSLYTAMSLISVWLYVFESRKPLYAVCFCRGYKQI